jgi:hypothetical protein
MSKLIASVRPAFLIYLMLSDILRTGTVRINRLARQRSGN